MLKIDVIEQNLVLYSTNLVDEDLTFIINNPNSIKVRFECSINGIDWFKFTVASQVEKTLYEGLFEIDSSDCITFSKLGMECVNYIRIRSIE